MTSPRTTTTSDFTGDTARRRAAALGVAVCGHRVILLDGREGVVQSAYGTAQALDYFDVLLDNGRVVPELDEHDISAID